jgi:predicted amidophosphoribosyltransferase
MSEKKPATSNIFANARATTPKYVAEGATAGMHNTMVCPSCGAAREKLDETLVCRYCGTKLVHPPSGSK